jgi:GDP-L-fucose synthase
MGRLRIWVAGHKGMVGSAIVRRLRQRETDVLTVDRSQVDLRRQAEVEQWLGSNAPDVVILAAAKVGGILANDSYPADFLVENLAIQTNVIQAAHRAGVDRLVFLGSSCIYPKFAPQPIREDSLLTGPLEPTNEWYAIAKIAGIKTCQALRKQHGRRYISVMPCNLYGPNDNFDLASSHVLPALMRKFHEAKATGAAEVVVWGTGTPLREFLHVDDLADGVLFCLDHYDGYDPIN